MGARKARVVIMWLRRGGRLSSGMYENALLLELIDEAGLLELRLVEC